MSYVGYISCVVGSMQCTERSPRTDRTVLLVKIHQISVKRITNPVTLDPHGRALPDGLYDPALGLLPNDRTECETCGLGSSQCPGHFGHIELPVPVYNPLFLKYVSAPS
jgi:DNA-directed RNA polymerase beta' subunit